MRAVERNWLKRIAYHEAGHAVAAFIEGVPLGPITIIPDGNVQRNLRRRDLGNGFRPDVRRAANNRQKIEAEVIATFAGPAAEDAFTGRRNRYAAQDDYPDIKKIASFVCESDEEMIAYLEWLAIRARRVVTDRRNWEAVKAVAAALLKHETIDAAKARTLIKAAMGKDAGSGRRSGR